VIFRRNQRTWEEIHRWDRLANYNSERYRGLVHTPEFQAEMKEEQALFDAEMEAEAKEKGWIMVTAAYNQDDAPASRSSE